MNVVLDTNVVVSSLLVQGSLSAKILQQFREGLWTLIISGKILEEYGEVLGRPKFGFSKDKITLMLKEIESRSMSVIPSQRYHAVKDDPDDNEFVDVAMEGKADYLVSGDAHLLKLKSFRTLEILSPAEFLARV